MAVRVAVTLGDVCGIGPETVIKTLAKYPRLRSRCFLVGDPDVACRELRLNKLSNKVRLSLAGSPAEVGNDDSLWMVDRGYPGLARLFPGKESALAGRAAFFWLVEATRWAINGRAGALVTAPVSKHAVSRTVQGFSGQTEVVARLAGVRDPVMMLGGLPLLVSEKVPALNVKGDIGLFDWSKYVIGDRQQVEIAHDQTNSTGRLGFPEWADQYIASKVAVSIQKMGVDTPAAQV